MMNFSKYKITLDLQDIVSGQSVAVKVGDNGRRIYISLADGGKPYIVADGTVASMKLTRTDGEEFLDVCEIKDNTVIYTLTTDATALSGPVKCELCLLGSDGTEECRLSSPTFTLMCYGTLFSEEVGESSDKFPALTRALIDVENLGVSASDNGDGSYTVTVTDKDGIPHSVTVRDGIDGRDGTPGKDGTDGTPGRDGVDGYTPVVGTDYFTEADRRGMVDQVVNAGGFIRHLGDTYTPLSDGETVKDIIILNNGTKIVSASAGNTAKYEDTIYIYNGTQWSTLIKGAYSAAKSGGYVGTEAKFYADLAALSGLSSWFASI